MKNIRFFLSKNFQFLVVKFSIYFRNVKNFGLSKLIQIRTGVEITCAAKTDHSAHARSLIIVRRHSVGSQGSKASSGTQRSV